jgi:hypothetical protein
VLSGAPSTAWTLATGGDLLASTEAAGTLLVDAGASRPRLLLAGAVAHGALSLGWAVVLARVLPRRHPVRAGVVAGLVIAAVDLGVVGRRVPAVRGLAPLPQIADHIAYGVVVATVLARTS